MGSVITERAEGDAVAEVLVRPAPVPGPGPGPARRPEPDPVHSLVAAHAPCRTPPSAGRVKLGS